MGSPGPLEATTPASNWPTALLTRANRASLADETHTPPSLRSVSCTVSPLDVTAKNVRLVAASATTRPDATPTRRVDIGLTCYLLP